MPAFARETNQYRKLKYNLGKHKWRKPVFENSQMWILWKPNAITWHLPLSLLLVGLGAGAERGESQHFKPIHTRKNLRGRCLLRVNTRKKHSGKSCWNNSERLKNDIGQINTFAFLLFFILIHCSFPIFQISQKGISDLKSQTCSSANHSCTYKITLNWILIMTLLSLSSDPSNLAIVYLLLHDGWGSKKKKKRKKKFWVVYNVQKSH